VFSTQPAAQVQPALAAIAKRLPKSTIIGCSTAGDIHDVEVSDGTIVVGIARFEHTALRQASCSIATPDESAAVGRQLALALDADDLAAIVTLSDGTNVNGATLVQGLSSGLQTKPTIVGGLAGLTGDASDTWVFADGKVSANQVVAIGLYGDRVRVGHGSEGGWDAFGPQRIVTKSDGGEVFELDNRSALALYQEYLGELASGLPATGMRFPLAIKSLATDDDFVMRSVVSVDDTLGSVRFAGDVPTGWTAQLMSGNLDRLIEGSAACGLKTSQSVPQSGPVLALAVSCVGRRGVLRERAAEEIEAAAETLPTGSALVGFYSYGEISPQLDGPTEFHNQTLTLATFGEA
jgi:hypothetical protein